MQVDNAYLLAGPVPAGVQETNVDALTANDPRLQAVVDEAWTLWQNALGRDLSRSTCRSQWRRSRPARWAKPSSPTGTPRGNRPPASSSSHRMPMAAAGSSIRRLLITVTLPVRSVVASSTAMPDTAAYGHYDLLTALLHELGHVEGFMPANPLFERYVQTTGGSQVFVAPGVFASLVDDDQELDPSIYPGDVLSATLAPGVRELPSALDVLILDVVNGYPARPSPVTVTPAPSASRARHGRAGQRRRSGHCRPQPSDRVERQGFNSERQEAVSQV